MKIDKSKFRILMGAATLLLLVWGSTAIESQAADSAWSVDYWNNTTLSGNPVLQRSENDLNYDWGNGTPATGIVNADNFSIRWTRSLSFNSGRYRFTVTSDDGARLWVNNQQIISAWTDHPPQTYSGEINLPGGSVPINLEYYDSTGGAQVQLTWVQVTTVPQPTPTPIPTSGTGVVQRLIGWGF